MGSTKWMIRINNIVCLPIFYIRSLSLRLPFLLYCWYIYFCDVYKLAPHSVKNQKMMINMHNGNIQVTRNDGKTNIFLVIYTVKDPTHLFSVYLCLVLRVVTTIMRTGNNDDDDISCRVNKRI